MPIVPHVINNGVIELFVASGDGGGVTVQIFYNPNVGVDGNGNVDPTLQPIRNVAGAALVATNTTGRTATVAVTGPSGPFLGDDGTRNVKVPPAGLSFTKAQLANQAGINTRADVSDFQLSSP